MSEGTFSHLRIIYNDNGMEKKQWNGETASTYISVDK